MFLLATLVSRCTLPRRNQREGSRSQFTLAWCVARHYSVRLGARMCFGWVCVCVCVVLRVCVFVCVCAHVVPDFRVFEVTKSSPTHDDWSREALDPGTRAVSVFEFPPHSLSRGVDVNPKRPRSETRGWFPEPRAGGSKWRLPRCRCRSGRR